MAYKDFFMIALNLIPDHVQALTTVIVNGILSIGVTLPEHKPKCPYCGGDVRIKDYSKRSYNHLPDVGRPSVIEWRRRCFACRDFGKSFSEPTVLLYVDSFLQAPRITLPENLHKRNTFQYSEIRRSYLAVLTDNIDRCLCDIRPNYSKNTLSRYFEHILKAEREKVMFVTIDLWEPYKSVELKFFPNACVTTDLLW